MLQFNNLEYDMSDAQSTMENGGPVYIFSNENIAEPMLLMGGLGGKRVLTVAASGDHAFEAYLAGAAHVDTFDFNILQKSVMDIKAYAIRHMSMDEFIKTFTPGPNMLKFSDQHMSQMTPEMLEFLDLYKQKHGFLFREYDYNLNEYGWAYYQDKHRYETLQRILPPKINFTHCDIRELPQRFHQRYDVIILSNIFSYVYGGQNEEDIQQMYNEVLQPLTKNNLTQNGYICAQYSWSYRYGDPFALRWEKMLESVNKQISDNGHYFEVNYITNKNMMADLLTSRHYLNPSDIPDHNKYSETDAITIMRQNQQKIR